MLVKANNNFYEATRIGIQHQRANTITLSIRSECVSDFVHLSTNDVDKVTNYIKHQLNIEKEILDFDQFETELSEEKVLKDIKSTEKD